MCLQGETVVCHMHADKRSFLLPACKESLVRSCVAPHVCAGETVPYVICMLITDVFFDLPASKASNALVHASQVSHALYALLLHVHMQGETVPYVICILQQCCWCFICLVPCACAGRDCALCHLHPRPLPQPGQQQRCWSR